MWSECTMYWGLPPARRKGDALSCSINSIDVG